LSKRIQPSSFWQVDNLAVDAGKVTAAIVGILILLAAAVSSAGTWPASQQHLQAHSPSHETHGRNAPVSPNDGEHAAWQDSASEDGCTSQVPGCCPGFAAAPSERACALVFDGGSALTIFASTLRLMFWVEGIYKPPWINS
jgi:hypothetical protein